MTSIYSINYFIKSIQAIVIYGLIVFSTIVLAGAYEDFFEATKLILIDAFGLDSSSILDAESGERLDSGIGLGTNWTGCTEVARRFGLLEYLNKEETVQEAA